MSINKFANLTDLTKSDSLPENIPHHIEESFDLSWNDIIYDGGLATWLTRSSFRWLNITVCLIGIIGKLFTLFFPLQFMYIYFLQVMFWLFAHYFDVGCVLYRPMLI